MPVNRQPMPEQPVAERIHNFKEVAVGYDAAAAANEASRCLQCKNSPCRSGCPVEVDIPAFQKKAADAVLAKFDADQKAMYTKIVNMK